MKNRTRVHDRWLQLLMICREQRWPLRRYERELRRYYAHPHYKGMLAVPTWIRRDVHDERLRRRRERQDRREEIQKEVQRAVAKGALIKPLSCENCNRRTIKRKLQAHHRDYRYPFKVIWLCQSCHVQAQGPRAVKRAAFYAHRRDLLRDVEARQKRLRRRYKEGHISRRRYVELQRELRTV